MSNSLFEKNFVFANNLNIYLEKIFPRNNHLLFKKWDFYYKMGMFEKAIDLYSKVKCESEKTCQKLYHNIGNSYYKSADFLDEKQQIEYYKNALWSYQKSLNYTFNDETKKNYDFVLNKLQALMDKIKEEAQKNENQKSQEKKDEDTQENQKQEQQQEQWQKSQWNSDEIIPKWNSIQISPQELETIEKWLTPQEKKEIQEYLEQLKREEWENRNFNKPQEKKDIFDIYQDFFGWWNFEKKDW